MHKSLFLASASVAAVFAASTPAAAQAGAGWDRIGYRYTVPGRIMVPVMGAAPRCSDYASIRHFSAGQPISVGTGPGSSQPVSFEVLANGIDLAPAPVLIGLPGASVTITDKRGGAANLGRGCGAIGSVVVNLTVPTNLAADATGEIRFGNIRVPVRLLVRNRLDVVRWLGQNLLPPAQPAPPRPAPRPAPPAPPPPGCTSGIPNDNRCNGVIITPPTTTPGEQGFRPDTIFKCMAHLEGALAGLNGDRLFIRLPADLNAARNAGCLAEPVWLFASTEFSREADLVAFARFVNQFNQTHTPAGSLTASFVTAVANTFGDHHSENGAFRLSNGAAFGDTIAAREHRIRVTNRYGAAPRELTLVVQTYWGTGVSRIEANPGPAMAAPRPGSIGSIPRPGVFATPGASQTVRVHLQETLRADSYRWVVAGSAAQRCFGATTGVVRTSSPTERSIDVSLPLTGAAGCTGQRVRFTAHPDVNGLADDPVVSRSVEIPIS